MNYYFAPMEGITGAVFRLTHHEFFPGIDKYFMPFITPTTQEKLTPRQKRDVLPEYNEGVPAVPQLPGRPPTLSGRRTPSPRSAMPRSTSISAARRAP